MAENAEKNGQAQKEVRPANKRGTARLGAVQALYQMDVGEASLPHVLSEFAAFRLGKEIDGIQYREADVQWFQDIVKGVVADQKFLDPFIHTALTEGWPLKRVDSLLRAILRAGSYELLRRKDVPARVIISEYIDIAKAFYDEDEPRLVNGVLDRLAHDLRNSEFKAPEPEALEETAAQEAPSGDT